MAHQSKLKLRDSVSAKTKQVTEINVTHIFDRELADLNRMFRGASDGNLHVSMATHNAYMQIAEDGAATGASSHSVSSAGGDAGAE